MIRFVFCIVCLAIPMASPAVAQDKDVLCATSGEIVGAAVTARADGTDSPTAIRAISKTLKGDQKPFRAAVQPIVDWVFTLDEAQLNDEVATSYVAACLSQ